MSSIALKDYVKINTTGFTVVDVTAFKEYKEISRMKTIDLPVAGDNIIANGQIYVVQRRVFDADKEEALVYVKQYIPEEGGY